MDRIESLKNFIDKQPTMFEEADATYSAIEELERLAEIGKATELMFDRLDDIITIKYFEKEYEEQEELYIDVDNSPIFNSLEDLLEWYRKEVE